MQQLRIRTCALTLRLVPLYNLCAVSPARRNAAPASLPPHPRQHPPKTAKMTKVHLLQTRMGHLLTVQRRLLSMPMVPPVATTPFLGLLSGPTVVRHALKRSVVPSSNWKMGCVDLESRLSQSNQRRESQVSALNAMMILAGNAYVHMIWSPISLTRNLTTG